MIGYSHRFHGRNSVRGVYQRGETIRSSTLSLKYIERAGRPYRLAVVVSRKVHKSAEVRNRIRRRIYEICRKQTTLDINGLDMVLTVFSDAVATTEHSKLQKQVEDLLKKATQHRSNMI